MEARSGEGEIGRVVMPSYRLDGRLAVVTGASQGIGQAIAHAFALSGAAVVLASRRRDALEHVATRIAATGGIAHVHATDVTDLASIDSLVRSVTDLREDGQPLVLVNNAGAPFAKQALDVTEADWASVMDSHLRGTFFCAQRLAPAMIGAGYGKVLNLSSTWAKSVDPKKSVYSAAKAAVSHLTAALATEWAPYGVRVNAIAPTAVTESPGRRLVLADEERARMLLEGIPLGRFETTNDLIGAAVFLASEASDFITGQTLFVDGGWSARG